jgi:hypothetical protein
MKLAARRAAKATNSVGRPALKTLAALGEPVLEEEAEAEEELALALLLALLLGSEEELDSEAMDEELDSIIVEELDSIIEELAPVGSELLALAIMEVESPPLPLSSPPLSPPPPWLPPKMIKKKKVSIFECIVDCGHTFLLGLHNDGKEKSDKKELELHIDLYYV